MTEPVVADSNIIIASFLEDDSFHQRGQEYINGLDRGDYIFHLPKLVVVEVLAAIGRQAGRMAKALVVNAQESIGDWERDGKIVLYELNRHRMDAAANIAIRDRLKGSDAVIAALAEELHMPLQTFDSELQQRFHQAPI